MRRMHRDRSIMRDTRASVALLLTGVQVRGGGVSGATILWARGSHLAETIETALDSTARSDLEAARAGVVRHELTMLHNPLDVSEHGARCRVGALVSHDGARSAPPMTTPFAPRLRVDILCCTEHVSVCPPPVTTAKAALNSIPVSLCATSMTSMCTGRSSFKVGEKQASVSAKPLGATVALVSTTAR